MGFASYYTFTNGACGDFSCKEDLDGLPCGDPDNFNDRLLPPAMTMTDVTIMACFGSCASDGSCDAVGVNGLEIDETLFNLQPTLVSGDYTNVIFGQKVISQDKEITILNSVGQIISNVNIQNTDSYKINTSEYTSGLYFVNIRTETTMLTKKFVVRK